MTKHWFYHVFAQKLLKLIGFTPFSVLRINTPFVFQCFPSSGQNSNRFNGVFGAQENKPVVFLFSVGALLSPRCVTTRHQGLATTCRHRATAWQRRTGLTTGWTPHRPRHSLATPPGLATACDVAQVSPQIVEFVSDSNSVSNLCRS